MLIPEMPSILTEDINRWIKPIRPNQISAFSGGREYSCLPSGGTGRLVQYGYVDGHTRARRVYVDVIHHPDDGKEAEVRVMEGQFPKSEGDQFFPDTTLMAVLNLHEWVRLPGPDREVCHGTKRGKPVALVKTHSIDDLQDRS